MAAFTGVFQSDDRKGGNAAATAWNAPNFSPSKYVSDIAINGATGEIQVTYGPNTPQISGQTLYLLPQQNVTGAYAALTTGQPGNIDWACSSQTSNTATGRTPTMVAPTPGSLLPKYAPTECK